MCQIEDSAPKINSWLNNWNNKVMRNICPKADLTRWLKPVYMNVHISMQLYTTLIQAKSRRVILSWTRLVWHWHIMSSWKYSSEWNAIKVAVWRSREICDCHESGEQLKKPEKIKVCDDCPAPQQSPDRLGADCGACFRAMESEATGLG